MSNPVPILLQQAISYHQQGRLQMAEELYANVLQLEPENFDALHLIGVIAKQRGDVQTALNFFGKALLVDPTQPALHCNLGTCIQALGESEKALASYDVALRLKPDYAMAWNNRGNALKSLARWEQALESYTRAIEAQPRYAEAYLNRGIALQTLKEHDNAILDFDDALHFQPRYAEAHFALAVSLQALDDYEAALGSYQQAVLIEPLHARALCNLAMLQIKLGQLDEALMHLDRALEIQADFANAHQQRGNVLRLMGRREEAVVAYQQAIALGADVTQLNFSLASLGEGQTPEAAPHNYVKELFDRYAPHFDAHLEQRLAYQVPALMKHALEQVLQPSGALMPCMDRVLDLGCGTGLCGDFLRPWTKHLSGVDLSENMLDQARMKGQYDDLQCADIHDYLETENDPVQLVLAADVLVYIGRLDRLFKLAHDRLADGGLFAFTVELNEDEGESEKRPGDYVLLGSQRYAHSEAYLRRLSQQTHDLDWKVDWKIEKLEMHIARHDHGKAIEIALGIFRKI